MLLTQSVCALHTTSYQGTMFGFHNTSGVKSMWISESPFCQWVASRFVSVHFSQAQKGCWVMKNTCWLCENSLRIITVQQVFTSLSLVGAKWFNRKKGALGATRCKTLSDWASSLLTGCSRPWDSQSCAHGCVWQKNMKVSWDYCMQLVAAAVNLASL